MKRYSKWRNRYLEFMFIIALATIMFSLKQDWKSLALLVVPTIGASVLFFGLWNSMDKYGMQTEFDISRVLGKEAKGALEIGNIGIVTYDDEFVATWESGFFKDKGISILNHKLTSWLPKISELFQEDVDVITGRVDGRMYEVTRKEGAKLLYVRDITELYELRSQLNGKQIVAGLMQLDNYMEYQSYEDEELVSEINSRLRTPLISWAKENRMLVRRIRSDRVFVLMTLDDFKKVREENLSILQIVKDEANAMDVSITLSMAFAYGTSNCERLDTMLNDLMELAQSRGGDQAAIQCAGGKVQYIGGNSETSTQRSKVRVRIMAQSIHDAIKDSRRVFIAGHVNSDYDCMGAALAMSNWVKTLKKEAYIVLKDVPRDGQLQDTMVHYKGALNERHRWITPDDLPNMMDSKEDLLIMVDHAFPDISSARHWIANFEKIIVIDHHRRNDRFVESPMLTYVESTASSSCELIVEMLQNTHSHIPIFEAEATIMYLGILVDTNRFKMHTSARTFEAAAALRSWGANGNLAEKALCEDFAFFQLKTELVQEGKFYYDRFMVASITTQNLDRTMMAQISDLLLKIKGCQASFTIARNADKPDNVAISARSDGSYNVQKIMEKMQGGGHFSAAAVERANCSVEELQAELLEILREDIDESNSIEGR